MFSATKTSTAGAEVTFAEKKLPPCIGGHPPLPSHIKTVISFVLTPLH